MRLGAMVATVFALLLGAPSVAHAQPFDGSWQGKQDPPTGGFPETLFSWEVTRDGTNLTDFVGVLATEYAFCFGGFPVPSSAQIPIAPDGSFAIHGSSGGTSLTGRFTSRTEASGSYTVTCEGFPKPKQTYNWKATLQRPSNPAVMVRPPPKEGCATEITVGGRTAWSGCFKRASDGWRSTERVRLSGIDLQPNGGKAIELSDRGFVSGDMKVSLRAGADVLPNVEWVLWDGDFELDATKQRVLSLQQSASLPPARMGGMDVQGGKIELAWTADGAQLTLALKPGKELTPFAGATLDPPGGLKRGLGLEATLKTTNETGVVLSSISAQAELTEGLANTGKAFLVKDLKLTYYPWDRIWSGSGTVAIGGGKLKMLGKSEPELNAEVGFTIDPVGFAFAKAKLQNINKHIGYGVFLRDLGGELRKEPPPWQFIGKAKLSLGPKLDDGVPFVGGRYAVDFDGTYTWKPWFSYGQTGTAHVVGQPFYNASAEVDFATGSAKVGGTLSADIAGTGIRGFVAGWTQGGQFQLQGNGEITVLGQRLDGAQVLINTGGMAGCRAFAGLEWGFAVDWRRGFAVRVMGGSCDFGDLVVERPRKSQATGARTFEVRRGSRGVGLRLHSDAGDPAVVLRGPGGAQLTVPATAGMVDTPQLSALRDGASHDLYVALPKPRAGRWTVEPLPGAPPIAALSRADALPPPSVRARVRRRGARRVLSYRARRIPGQRVRFVERGPGGLADVLGTTRKRRGRIAFTPKGTSAGRHTIQAVVLQSGRPRDVRTVARFRYRPFVPSAPKRLRARRRRGDVTLRWRRVTGARRYVITGRLKDGRELRIETRRARARLRDVSRGTAGRLTVRGISSAGRQGRASRVAIPNARKRRR